MNKTNKKYTKSLFIFRRDLRLEDNTGLLQALEQSSVVIPCFIVNPEQVGPKNNYKSNNALQFMLKSLLELNESLKKHTSKLFLFYGKPEDVVKDIITHEKIDAIFVNQDYTPYSKKRDSVIQKICAESALDFLHCEDLLLVSPDTLKTKQKKIYTVFTPFYKAAQALNVAQPRTNTFTNYFKKSLKTQFELTVDQLVKLEAFNYNNPALFKTGGRKEGLALLKDLKNLQDYPKTRDFLALPTSGLSPHNKFGTVSIREVYYACLENFGKNSTIIKELYWRDFFTYIAYHFPRIFRGAFHEQFNNLAWNTSQDSFKRWCTGTTGFPLVDAGMRQLNTSGWMHNRARLVVASFLVKDLLINWQWGEKYFAQNLVDYDPSVNNGNWQWVASTGCDAQPYFRIFNPWLQQKKFDPECTYIKRWVPELKNIPTKDIHAWYKKYTPTANYPAPMVNHTIQARQAQVLFKKIKASD